MAPRRYLDFDLLLEQRGDGQYEARVTQCPLGETPSVAFQLPFDATALENLLLKLDPGRVGTRRVGGSSQQQAAMDLGGPLYQAIFSGDLGVAWTRSLDRARSAGSGLRLRLRLNDAAGIAGLPWELLYDAKSNAFLAQSEKTPLVRFLDVPDVPRPLTVDGPLRVLTIISSPTDLDELDVEAEWRRMGEALAPKVAEASVVLDRLPSATLSDLGTWLRQHETHVIHFVGHGDFDDRLREGVLYFQDQQGRGTPVTSTVLGPYLRDHDPLRMVVLNACRSAREDGTDPFAGMAQGLVQQDVTAVVAMQFPISDRAAVAFSGEFYSALVDGLPVDQAVSSARKALLADFRDEWATPVLFLRAPDGNIFENVHADPDVVPPPPPPPPPPPERRPGGGVAGLTAWVRGHRLAVAGPVALVLVLVLVIVLAVVLATRGGPPAGGPSDSSTNTSSPPPATATNDAGLPVSAALDFNHLLIAAGPNKDELHIYLADRTGALVKQLTSGDPPEQGPALSPSRDSFIFSQRKAGTSNRFVLFIAAVDGSGRRPLFPSPPSQCALSMERPAWSRADLDLIVTACTDTNGKHRLMRLSMSGKQDPFEYQLPPGMLSFGDPAISPNGQTLMFWASPSPVADGGELFQVPVGGGTPTRITTATPGSTNQDSDAVFAPNGHSIAFRRRLPTGTMDVFVAGPSAQSPKDVTDGLGRDAQDPSFSPASDEVAFRVTETDGSQIYVVPVTGGEPQPLFASRPQPVEAVPAWSRR